MLNSCDLFLISCTPSNTWAVSWIQEVDEFAADWGHRCVGGRRHPDQKDPHKSFACHLRYCFEGHICYQFVICCFKCCISPIQLHWPRKPRVADVARGVCAFCTAVNNMYQHVKSRWSKNAASRSIITQLLTDREKSRDYQLLIGFHIKDNEQWHGNRLKKKTCHADRLKTTKLSFQFPVWNWNAGVCKECKDHVS